jgi:hypothetical protein
MKARKKFNRGVIITAIALLCISIYLIGLDITQNAEKPAIQKVVGSYINTYVSYNMLPQSYRIATPDIPKAEMDSYIAKMESDIKSYFAVNDDSYKFMTDMLKSDLKSQKSETTVVYSYKKTISKYTEFKFDKSNVTVTVETNSSYDGPDIQNPNSGRLKLNAVTTDTIVLKKVDGEWKVVYSNINRPSQSNSLGGGIVIEKRIR